MLACSDLAEMTIAKTYHEIEESDATTTAAIIPTRAYVASVFGGFVILFLIIGILYKVGKRLRSHPRCLLNEEIYLFGNHHQERKRGRGNSGFNTPPPPPPLAPCCVCLLEGQRDRSRNEDTPTPCMENLTFFEEEKERLHPIVKHPPLKKILRTPLPSTKKET